MKNKGIEAREKRDAFRWGLKIDEGLRKWKEIPWLLHMAEGVTHRNPDAISW